MPFSRVRARARALGARRAAPRPIRFHEFWPPDQAFGDPVERAVHQVRVVAPLTGAGAEDRRAVGQLGDRRLQVALARGFDVVPAVRGVGVDEPRGASERVDPVHVDAIRQPGVFGVAGTPHPGRPLAKQCRVDRRLRVRPRAAEARVQVVQVAVLLRRPDHSAGL